MRGGQVGEGVEVTVEGDSADGIKDDMVVMVGEGGDKVLGRRVNKERGEDQTGKKWKE